MIHLDPGGRAVYGFEHEPTEIQKYRAGEKSPAGHLTVPLDGPLARRLRYGVAMRIIIIFLALVGSVCAGELSLLKVGTRFEGPVAYQATGAAGVGLFKKKRDRTYRFTPRQTAGGLVLDTELADKVSGKTLKGSFALDEDGVPVGSSGEMLSATNLLNITAKVLETIAGGGSVRSPGRIAVNGKVQDVTFTHSRGASAREVVTEVSGRGGIALTTVTRMASDGLPQSAKTTGTVGVAAVDLSLERLR